MATPRIAPPKTLRAPSKWATWTLLAAIFLAVQFASLFTPPLLDDVDASHAQVAQHMDRKRRLGHDEAQRHSLPRKASAALLARRRALPRSSARTSSPPTCPTRWRFWGWRGWRGCGRRADGVARAGFYAGLAVLTSIGPFLFTRFAIPEALLSFLLLYALWSFITGLESRRPGRFYGMWAALALATLTKGLIAPVFFAAAAIPLLLLSGQWRRWRELKPFTGILLFLAIAAPWHILCGLANPDQGHPVGNHPTPGNVHGFWYFYFINEHLLRFIGGRFPHDYNKMPFACVLAGASGLAFSVEPVSAGAARRGLANASQLAAAPAPRLRPDRGFLSRTCRARRRGQLRSAAQVSRALHLAALAIRGIHAAVLLHLDQPGVLHVSPRGRRC